MEYIPVGTKVTFRLSDGSTASGIIRREQKVSDFWLVDSYDKRYLITTDELLDKTVIQNDAE